MNFAIMLNQKIKQFKKILKIDDEIIGVKFTTKPLSGCTPHRDTACTAIARTIFKKEGTVFDAKTFPQACQGANYFLKLSNIKDSDVYNSYINQEKIFSNKKTCQLFLKNLPKLPAFSKNKFINIKIFNFNDNPCIAILLANPAQAGRILGLLNHKRYRVVEIYPNQPTCLSLFAPLVTKTIHCNFIDYYDRYYQGRNNKKLIWPKQKMIISIRNQEFKEILNNLNKSAQGSFRPN
ncbi:MAG: DUF169 domain-containing protein, partial [bacterium]|nr:DUF169 domain-containing protein [bacterium]